MYNICTENICDYIEKISTYSDSLEQDIVWGYDRLFFRGQDSVQKFTLLPSIARRENDNIHNSLFFHEEAMIKQAMLMYPEEFSEEKYPVNLLSKLQHYGIPTRMLDITENALVALYFACDGNNSKDDGEVFMFHLKPYNLITAYDFKANMLAWLNNMSWVTSFNFLEFLKEIKYESFLPKNEVDKMLSNIDKAVRFISKPTFIFPEYRSERQKRQQSAFIIFSNQIESHGNEYFFTDKVVDIKKAPIEEMKYKFVIKANLKEKILKELRYFGIHRQFLFPEMETGCKEIAYTARNLYK